MTLLSDCQRGDLVRLVNVGTGLEIVGKVIREMDDYGNVWVRPARGDGLPLCKPEEIATDAEYVITEHKRASRNEVHRVRKSRTSSSGVGH